MSTLLRVFLPFALGYFLSYLFRTVNGVAGPELVRDLGLTAGELGLLTSAYFLSFALAQLPLGLMLDRFGPRISESALLIVAALGALLFALADSVGMLIVARALIGLGVAACLMAAFKAFVMFFPRDRLPLVNGFQMAAGGLGALSATTPVEMALGMTDWRGVFLVLAALSVVSAVLIFLVVPERPQKAQGASARQLWRGVTQVYSSPAFWRVAPVTMASQAAFLSIQTLWAAPWLRDIAGFDRAQVADQLFLMAVSMIAGFLASGAIAERLGRVGIKPMTVAIVNTIGACVVQGVVIAEWTGSPTLLWMAFGFFGSAGVLAFAALSQAFPPELAGRANTGLNALVFGSAFLVQWGIGVVIGLWPETASGGYQPEAYQAAFAGVLVLQLLGLSWYAIYRR